MNEGKKMKTPETGRYLPNNTRHRKNMPIRLRQCVTVLVLLSWDGLLLYMIVRCLIDGVYGAVFMAVISVTMGYHMK